MSDIVQQDITDARRVMPEESHNRVRNIAATCIRTAAARLRNAADLLETSLPATGDLLRQRAEELDDRAAYVEPFVPR